MPLSTTKCAVLHYGLKQPNYAYVIGDQALKRVDSFVDLGVTRTCDLRHSSQCSAMAAKAAKAAYVIRKTFQTRNPNLLWPAFQCYVISIIMYAREELHRGALPWQKMLKSLSVCKDASLNAYVGCEIYRIKNR